MKKVLCGLVIAVMMTGTGYADKLSDKIKRQGFGSSYTCNAIGDNIDFHNVNAEDLYKIAKVSYVYQKYKSDIQHHVLMARANLEIYNLMCSVD